MDLLLIRHGEQKATAFGTDPDLTGHGRRQAGELAAHLASERIDALWVSPLARARQTAEPLAECQGLEPVVHPSLQELGRCDLIDPALDDSAAHGVLHHGWERLRRGAPDAVGLDVAGFRHRVRSVVESVVARHRSMRVAIVCHGGVINSYLATVLGLSQPMWFEPSHGSIQRIRASTVGHRTVLALNERCCQPLRPGIMSDPCGDQHGH